ncbi:BTAD domain-containing putative transcriptional regulator [Streptomyces sp. NPDC056600]|uniref:AfsR/SARP family transcriptional regulator n=1 Tax=Streptomyces sp. NPDC056600 TaxID=3345874 RepID=UPI00368DD79D
MENGAVRFRVLGTIQAIRPDGTSVPVGGAKLRTLLTLLALRPGRAVPVSVLVDEVWADDPPADATGALQALVGRLRRLLGPGAVASADGGYLLDARPDDVDLYRFERLTADGLRALADGDPAKAAETLDEALALWRGPALADLPHPGAEAARWEARRLDARRARLTAALSLGEAAAVLPDLTALCEAHPLDEPLQALRLRALAAAGRPAEALAAYEGLRRHLADTLGADPGPALRATHADLLRPAPASARPRHEAGPSGESAAAPRQERERERDQIQPGVQSDVRSGVQPGVRSVAGSAPPAARAGDGPLPGSPPHDGRAHADEAPAHPLPGNLRARLTSFVGRDPEIQAIHRDLRASRLVTLLGPGGAGKTRLSQEAAETLHDLDRDRDGVWLAELAPVTVPSAVPEAVLTAVGGRETTLYAAGAEEMRVVSERRNDALERLAEHCSRRRMVLILDNCEHVVDAAARLAEELLARCPHLTVLATSREPLGVPGELVRPVEPLPEPHALRLLADRGAAARPGFTPDSDPDTAVACAEICRRLDGLPLAIELAAARLRMLTPRQLVGRLDDRFRLLTSGSRTALPRQQTLRAVVDWSWDLLDEDERAVLARLSVFSGGCDLDAAEAVCGPAALDALGSLVDKSLVVAAPSPLSPHAGMRYRLLETVAEYARERLDEAGSQQAAARAHLTYYRELARTTDPLLRGRRQSAAIARLETEYENLRTAMRTAVAHGDEQEALCLFHSLAWYWQMRDQRSEARGWAQQVLALGPDPFARPVRKAVPLWERPVDAPPPMTGEALWEARRGVHLVHLASMDIGAELGEWQSPAGQDKLRAITEVYEPGMPQVCRSPGSMWFFALLLTGQADRLQDVVQSAERTCRSRPGMEWELATSLHLQASLYANRPDMNGDPVARADEGLEIFRRLGDDWGVAEALSGRGDALQNAGAFEEAAATFEEAVELAERIGAHAQVNVLRARLGALFLETDRPERGERILREVLRQESGGRDAGVAARITLISWLGVSGHVDEARDLLADLRAEFPAAGFAAFSAFIDGGEAWLDIADGRWGEALRRIRGALVSANDVLAQTVAPQIGPHLLVLGAAVLAGDDGGRRAADGARCLGAAEEHAPAGHVSTVMEREICRRAREAVRAALGDEAFEAAHAEGRGLSLEEAAALV